MEGQLTANLPVGDLQLYDNYVPSLDAGNWHIEVKQTLAKDQSPINTDALSATQEFVVSAPQFAIDPAEVLTQYPPDGSTGKYGEVLPNIVLKEPALPWERKIDAAGGSRQPWLAVLTLEDTEFIGAKDSLTRSTATTVAGFLRPDSLVLKPAITKEDDVADTDRCSYIQISTTVFRTVMPRLGELRYLAHCRQANITDKAAQGLNQKGLCSVVVANRFPALPPADSRTAVKNIVHLVSVEGLEKYLVDQPDFGAHTSVALLSLASWTFQCLPDNREDFRGLIEAMVASEAGGHAQNLWLRLPAGTLNTSGTHGAEASRRLQDGFVPLAYRTRTGEKTFGWYRGPLVPVLTTPLQKTGPFLTADSAIIYQPDFGLFDLSLAAAWETGRAAALADGIFGQQLLDFRRRAHNLTDALLHRLQSDFFSQDQIGALSHDTTVQDEFLKVLNAELLHDIGRDLNPGSDTRRTAAARDTSPKAAVLNFLAMPEVQKKILALVSDDLEAISQWLARLLLLYPVPFNALVPDARMLPVESLRFFYLDNNWLAALLDGALSIGVDSSRQTFFHTVTHDLVHRSAEAAAQVYRDQMLGVKPAPRQEKKTIITGLLMRSGIVSGWPNLAVRPCLSDEKNLKVLRMDHLSPNVLLCLFWGIPDYVEISEPQEGFRFGTDDDGFIPLRQPRPPTKPGDPPLGTQLKRNFQVRDLTQKQQRGMRAKESRVLNLAPASQTGLIEQLKAALSNATGKSAGDPGPGDFAMQMVKSPEAVRFKSQPAK